MSSYAQSETHHFDVLRITPEQQQEVDETAAALTARGPSGSAKQFASATMDANGNTVSTEIIDSVTQGNSNDMMPTEPGAGRILSARDPIFNHPVGLSNLTPDSIVTVEGVGDMTYRSALDAGLVAAPGQFPQAPVQQPAPQQQPAPDKAAPETHADLVVETTGSVEVEQALTNIAETVTGDLQVAAVHEIAETGDLSDTAMQAVASEMNLEPEAARTLVDDTIRPAMEAQADAAIGDALGSADPELVEVAKNWMAENKQTEVGAAVRKHLMQRQTGGYKALAEEFVQNLDSIAPDAILEANLGDGVTVERDHQDRIIIHANGQSFDWKGALAMGVVKFGG